MADNESPIDAHPVVLAERLREVRKDLDETRAELRAIQQDRAAERERRADDEKKRLRAGIAALGTVVLTLAGLIWWLLPSNAQHAWDLLRQGQDAGR